MNKQRAPLTRTTSERPAITFSWAVKLWHIECAACNTESVVHPDDLMGETLERCPACRAEIENIDSGW